MTSSYTSKFNYIMKDWFFTSFSRVNTTSALGTQGTGSDLAASPYGSPIPILFGKAIVPGVAIWSGEILNVVDVTTTQTGAVLENQGGGGPMNGTLDWFKEGPVTTSSTSALTGNQVADLAVAFGTRAPGTNKCTILRLWVNSILVYDQTNGTSIVDSGQFNYTLYNGDETQLPDPTIVAAEGNKTPGFLGLVYAVFKAFPFAASGGAFPSISAEVSCSSKMENPVLPFNSLGNSGTPVYTSNQYLINWANSELYVNDKTTNWDNYDIDNAVLKSNNAIGAEISTDAMALSLDGKFAYTFDGSIVSNSTILYVMDAQTGAILSSFGNTGASTVNDAADIMHPAWLHAVRGTYGVDEYLASASLLNGRCSAWERNGVGPIAFHADYTVVGGTAGIAIKAVTNGVNKFFPAAAMSAAPPIDQQNFSFFYFLKFGNVYCVTLAKTIQPTKGLTAIQFPMLYLPRIATGGTNPLTNSWTMAVGTDGIELTDIAFAANEHAVYGMTGPPDDPWLTILVVNTVAGTSYVRRYDSMWNRKDYTAQALEVLDAPSQAHMTLVFDIQIPFHAFNDQTDFISQDQRRPGTYWLMNVISGQYVKLVNFETGEQQAYDEGLPTYVNALDLTTMYGFAFSRLDVFDPLTGTAIYVGSQGASTLAPYPGKAALWVTDDGGLLLSSLLLQYCLAAGYLATDIDVTGVVSNDTTVTGSIINTSVDLSTLLGQVCELFRVDVVESEGKIKFSRKTRGVGMVVDFDLTDDDLAQLQQSSSNDGTLVDSDRNPSLLPSILVTNYLDYDNLCAIGSQSAKRRTFPFATTKLTAQETLNVPVIMTASEALYWTTFCLFDQWAGDTLNTIRTGQANLAAEPGDIVKLTRADGKVYVMKAETTTLNADLSVTIIGRTFNQFNNPVVPPPIPGTPRQQLLRATDVALFMLDNFLYDPAADPGDGSRIPYCYAVNAPASIQILRGSTYADFAATTQIAVTGSPVGTLADRPLKFMWQTDTVNTIVIDPASGDPAGIQTVSDAEFLAGVNALVIGASERWELVYFKTVVHNANGTLTLSNLLRGRRGTDVFAGTHTGRDTVVFLPFLPLTFSIGELGVTESIRVANLSSPLRPAIVNTWTSNGGPLKPWAGSVPKAAYSGGDIDLTWYRRTRLASVLHDGDGLTPLGEATEAYEVDIYKAGVVIRTIAGLTASAATYTAAMQTTDTNSGLASIEVAIYQLSAIMKRGYARHVTVDVTP